MPDPKFLYGSHYSTPGYVLYYLVRVGKNFYDCRCKDFENLDQRDNSCFDNSFFEVKILLL